MITIEPNKVLCVSRLTVFVRNEANNKKNKLASTKDNIERENKYKKLRHEIEDAKRTTGYAKRELRMPGTAGLRLTGALKYLLRLIKTR